MWRGRKPEVTWEMCAHYLASTSESSQSFSLDVHSTKSELASEAYLSGQSPPAYVSSTRVSTGMWIHDSTITPELTLARRQRAAGGMCNTMTLWPPPPPGDVILVTGHRSWPRLVAEEMR